MVRRSNKLNKLKSLYDSPSLSVILRKAATRPDDLQKVADMLGITVPLTFNWVYEYNPKLSNPQILNMGFPNPALSGTHWVCVVNDFYFDPFGMPPPPEIIFKNARAKKRNQGYIPLTIQNTRGGGCGVYCVLFIYYALKNEIDEFYSLFNMSNTLSDRDN